jgi:mannose-6-phosphate isomerase-like protein (cupin superfamily)
MPMSFETNQLSYSPDAIAPDGSEVRILCRTRQGSLAHFTLPPNTVSKSVAHHTVDEAWYFISGQGQMWRRLNEQEDIVDVEAGVSITIPVGTHFQFRSNTGDPLTAVGVTMPPWPGENEAFAVQGPWKATL